MRKLNWSIGLALCSIYSKNTAVAEVSCNTATLTGSYIISALGTNDGSAAAYVGMISYDGRGSYRIRIHFAGPSQTTTQDTGTYIHLGGCEFEATANSGRSAHYFVAPTGDWFKYVMKSGGNMLGDAQRISSDLLIK
ncbi:hypothetical protein [Aestuariivirga sp.]|jgi:hypothetical protein|uniref:hypothetical protein n=1 Tax=Aestuariivirga sp. TaxID=2650926 RepID=UPI0037846505